MSFSHWFTVAGLALLPLVAPAQQTQQQPDPADANAAALAPGYTSAFTNYRPATDHSASPDKVWRAANEEVQTPAGHAAPMQDAGMGNAPSAPKADPHAGHHGHHSKGK